LKFEVTDSFRADFKRLSLGEQTLFRNALPSFVAACERFSADPTSAWPTALRVKDVENAPGIWEVTFHFAGPDIRGTFEWVQIDGELGVRWRRIGGHAIFRKP
jgi:hypothetical protein